MEFVFFVLIRRIEYERRNEKGNKLPKGLDKNRS